MHIPQIVFRGSAESPFLAPRGIFVHENILAVCDTAQNRVFIWNKMPTTEYSEPDIILGNKADNNSNTTNSFYYPSGLWTNGKILIVADAWNHRVLIWHTFPTINNAPADVVIGQADFTSNLPNITGINSTPNALSLFWCYGVFSNGKELWIADTGNRRILYFDNIPTKNFCPANAVIGQSDFSKKDFMPDYSTWPYSIKISDKGEMLVSDTQYFRVHYWKNWQDALIKKADVLLGQNNFENNGQNQFFLKPKCNTLSWVYDAIFDNNTKSIFIADTGNSRVLKWNNIPHENNLPANDIYGQQHFEAIGENKESIMGFDNFMYWPFSITTNNDFLIVCETGNNRIFFYQKQ